MDFTYFDNQMQLKVLSINNNNSYKKHNKELRPNTANPSLLKTK